MDNKLSPGDPAPSPGHPRVRVSSPADVLAVVPRLLGFHPASSFVVIGAGRPRDRIELTFRYDLPDPPDPGRCADIAQHAVAVLTERRLAVVLGVGYGPGNLVTPVADELAAALRRAGLWPRELLRVSGGRYWSYICRNPGCCPAEGVPFNDAGSPAAAALTVAGLSALPDRAALASTLASVTGPAAASMDRATSRARQRATDLLGRAGGPGAGSGVTRLLVAEGRRAVLDAVRTYREGGQLGMDDAFAWLSVVLAQLPVRDDAWARMDPRYQAAHLRLWTDVVCRARERYLPGPASLLAFTAWQAGNGALANIAIDRALAADPGYSMAQLLRDVMDAGVPPSAARAPMTPEQVEASYAVADAVAAPDPPRPAGSGRRATRKRPSR